MKHKMKLLVWGIFIMMTASSFTFATVGDARLTDDEPQKKERHVKMMIQRNGELTNVDTIIVGETDQEVKAKVDSMLESMDIKVMHRDGGRKMVWIEKGDAGADRQHFRFFTDSVTVTEQGDSMKVQIRKHMGKPGDEEERYIFFQDGKGNRMMVPPVPPVPPLHGGPNQMIIRRFDSSDAINLKDPDIVSFERKDMGKGLEKITIVRKKRDNKEIKHEVEVIVDDTKSE